MNNLHSPEIDRLFEAILSLQSKEECYAFFEDACTIRELTEIAKRFDVAQLLEQGKSYAEIAAETGVSTATICRVNKCLCYGTGGYKTALKRQKTTDK